MRRTRPRTDGICAPTPAQGAEHGAAREAIDLRFGIRFNSDSGAIPQVVELARRAEAAGFDDVWVCHDLFKRDAWITLTAIAAATRRIRLGTAIVNPFTADPSELAMRAASLQEVSGGRFILGIGPGEQSYLRWAGRATRRPAAGVREAVHLIRGLLEGRRMPFDGRVFGAWTSDAYLRMGPPGPRVPVYVGGQGPAMLRLMGQVGDGALPILFPPENAPRVVAAIREGAEAAGRPPDAVDICGCIWYALGEDAEAARQVLRPLIAGYGPALRADILASVGLTPADFAAIGEAMRAGDRARAESLVTEPMYRLAIAGDPATVTARLAALRDAGISHINIGPPLGPNPARAIEITGDHVLPRLRPR